MTTRRHGATRAGWLGSLTTTIQQASDAYVARVYYAVVCLLLAFVTLFTAWYAGKLAADWEQWVIADWLISYAPGFVRRGLSGELLLALSDASGVPANRVVYWAIVGLSASFSVLLAILLRNRRITFWYVFLCLSPLSVLFTFYNEPAVGRKEWLLFVAFAAWTVVSTRRRPVSPAWPLAFGVLACVLSLMHEMFFFFTPYFVIAAALGARQRGGVDDWRLALAIPLASAAAVALVASSSASLNDAALCARLTSAGAPASVCQGVLEYQETPVGSALAGLAGRGNAVKLGEIAAAGLIVLVPLVLFLAAGSGPSGISGRRMLAAAAAAFAWSVPLFLLAVDWGRWMAIHSMLLTIASGATLHVKTPENRPPGPEWRMVLPAAAGALVLALAFTWNVKYCCGADLVVPLGPVESIAGLYAEIASNAGWR